ncbi:hypothetical protein PJIAN_4578 [Paludibacter jiangxiensis]|uniref:Uncharacterized protein n=1 Tax=Paludibacter jiangxiensis TaxID=681398 RepID=A0A161LFS0_9BACT|nr:hypothetical protein PJIAN_4578 [Paludibacter jiangxiensis]
MCLLGVIYFTGNYPMNLSEEACIIIVMQSYCLQSPSISVKANAGRYSVGFSLEKQITQD